MSDYGFRISKNGQDVKTCSDENTIINSKFSLLKGFLSGGGTISVNPDSTSTVTITHSLGYIPIAQVYTKFPLDNQYHENPDYADGASYSIYVWHYTNSSQLVMKFKQYSGSGAISFNYKYFIFLDKGKV